MNEIIDTSPLDELEQRLRQFKLDTKLVLLYLSKNVINREYINTLTLHANVRYVFRSMDTDFYISNCPSIMAYSRVTTPETTTYYILLICTKHQYKCLGYASSLLHDFIQHVKTRSISQSKPTKIVLSSLDTAVTYYEKCGFVWTRQEISDHPELLRYEIHEPGKEYFIMELAV